MKVINKDEFYVVGLKITCLEHELYIKMPKLYQEFSSNKNKIKNNLSDLTLDICLDRVDNAYTQFIGFEVSNINEVPNGMLGLKIPDAKYIYHIHHGNVADIFTAFVKMYDYALENNLNVGDFKIEMHDDINMEYHLYLKIN